MEDMSALFSGVVNLFKVEITLYKVTFSLWEVFLFVIAASITIWIAWNR